MTSVLLLALALACGWCAVVLDTSTRGHPWRRRLHRWTTVPGRRLWVLPVAVGVLSAVVSLGVVASRGEPVPRIHDEFAYILSGETFASGRVTNPPHPMSRYFETFHVFFHPTYQAKYPPGQGLFIAAGILLSGKPIVGVWLSLALACAVTCWMLIQVVPARWAFLGSVLLCVNPYLQNWWGQSYWGGGVAMLGGALAFGSAVRMAKERHWWPTVGLSLGLVTVGSARPEALVPLMVFAPALAWAQSHTGRRGGASRELILRLGCACGGALLVLGAGLLYYNWRLTGDPMQYFYLQARASASAEPLVRGYGGGPDADNGERLYRLWRFYLGPFLTVALLGLVRIRPRAVWAVLAAACGAYLCYYMVLSRAAWPHYIAPVTSAFAALVAMGLWEMSRWELRGRRWGLGCVVALLFLHGASAAAVGRNFVNTSARSGWAGSRAELADRLRSMPQRDLVLVRYGESHDIHEEWVYNAADIDAAEVVWARDLGQERNSSLLAYYPERKVWLLLADERPPRVVPLAPAERSEYSETGRDSVTGSPSPVR